MKKAIILVLLLTGIQFGCLDDIEEARLDLPVDEISIPKGLVIQVGDGSITVSWETAPDAVTYKVYRTSELSQKSRCIAETADTFYVDTDVIIGRTYYYSVSSVIEGGLEGEKSEEIAAVPMLYSILINGGSDYTGSLGVTLTLTAPVTTDLMKIGNDSTLSGAVWETFTPVRSWSLDEGDGEKTVYAMFRDESGSLSPVVSSSITLDTYAKIIGISFQPLLPEYSPGSTLHFLMNVESDETGGGAWIRFEGFPQQVTLYDDGRGGDQTASDGVYEGDFDFPESVRGLDIIVTGEFIDRAGNRAPSFEADEQISFTDPPEAVQLVGVDDSTTSSITIRWVASMDEHFLYYRIYRDTLTHAEEEEDPEYLVQELSNINQTQYPDIGLIEGVTYYYRVFVVNDLFEATGSNEIMGSTYDAYPDPVVLDTLSAIGTDRVTLTWSENQNTDFKEYRIYRATQPGVTTGSLLVTTITEQEITFYDDFGLDLVSNTYYYRVYIFDRGGKSSRSNERSTAP